MTLVARDAMFWSTQDYGSDPVGIPTRMIYTIDDPYAVKLIFGYRSGLRKRDQVEWIFGRDLLAAGIFVETGEGDVRVDPIDSASEIAGLTLIGLDSQVTLLVKKLDVAQFLDLTYGLCPQGDEGRYMTLHVLLRRLTTVGGHCLTSITVRTPAARRTVQVRSLSWRTCLLSPSLAS